MVAWRYEISLLVSKKYFTRSLRSLMKYFSTIEDKFRFLRGHIISSISTIFDETKQAQQMVNRDARILLRHDEISSQITQHFRLLD